MAEKKDGLGDNIWVLIPLAALSIPIFAVIGENVILTSVIAGLVALIGVTLLYIAVIAVAVNVIWVLGKAGLSGADIDADALGRGRDDRKAPVRPQAGPGR